jgi:hypothetical protein
MSSSALWRFLPLGYLLTILIETPILLVGLSKRHPIKRRLLAGLWLTACTYPVVVLVLPPLFESRSRAAYLVVAETFAPVAECILFWLAYGASGELGKSSIVGTHASGVPARGTRAYLWRDFAAIVVANLASFGAGEVLNAYGWFGLL